MSEEIVENWNPSVLSAITMTRYNVSEDLFYLEDLSQISHSDALIIWVACCQDWCFNWDVSDNLKAIPESMNFF